jgi:hypothetical protein
MLNRGYSANFWLWQVVNPSENLLGVISLLQDETGVRLRAS